MKSTLSDKLMCNQLTYLAKNSGFLRIIAKKVLPTFSTTLTHSSWQETKASNCKYFLLKSASYSLKVSCSTD